MRRIDLEKAETARASTMRGINRRIVLNYVRDRQPISRAEIARVTALQRSTVSLIVEELKRDELVEESGTGASSGGRRPMMLRLRAEGASAIGVDVTPTVTTILTSDLNGRVLERCEFPTSPDVEEMTGCIIKAVKKMARHSNARQLTSVGVSLPGLVDSNSGEAFYIPYFGWRNWNIGQQLQAATGLRVIVDNDANAAATAELWFGNEKTNVNQSFDRDFIMVIVAEGVGTGIIVDGQIYRGEQGAAGEFGHMIVGSNAPTACSCGSHDCWEAFASGRAAVARYEQSSGKSTRAPNAERRGEQETSFTELVDRALEGERAVN